MFNKKSHRKRRRLENRNFQEQGRCSIFPLRDYSSVWRPEDDYLLINSVFITSNLAEVYKCVGFSKPYSEAEIENRWRLLLFDHLVSRTALEAIANIPPIIKSHLDHKIPFSNEADDLLVSISYSDVFSKNSDRYSIFENLLLQHPNVFHNARPFDLYSQWNRLRSCSLIKEGQIHIEASVADQAASIHSPEPEAVPNDDTIGGDPSSFSDTEYLLKETVSRDLEAGLQHLTEPPIVARRQRMLKLPDYRGFQAYVSQSVVDSLQSTEKRLLSSKSVFPGSQSLRRSTSIQRKSPTHAASLGNKLATTSGEYSDSSISDHSADDLQFQRRRERYRLRRRVHARLQFVGEEARRWTALVESKVAPGTIISDHQPVFPTLATLTGKHSRFLIKSRKVTFGRASAVFTPDIDLSCEGAASRISRYHGEIYLGESGTFGISNFSRHPLFVDGIAVLRGRATELRDMSIITVSLLSLRFDVEHEYLDWISGCNDGRSMSPPRSQLDGEQQSEDANSKSPM